MNKVYWYIRGYLGIELRGAGIDRILNRMTQRYIPFWNLNWVDEFTLRLNIFPRDWNDVALITDRASCEISVLNTHGLKKALSKILARPVFLIGVVLCLMTVIILQNYIMFFEVIGNQTISDDEILRVLEELDIGFGTYGPDIKPKWIKDHVLNVLPQLQWITVTQNGCKAEVIVRERPEIPPITDRKKFTNVIAARSGMITQQSVLEGQALKKPGDFVVEGEMLVSGVVDLERKFAIVCAQAEIYAKTWHNKTIITPVKWMSKEECGENALCVWLEIGKRRIKIFENSGISPTACDKMIRREFLTLPGGLELPVSILVEQLSPYEAVPFEQPQPQAQMSMERYALRSVNGELLAGEVLAQRSNFARQGDRYCLQTVFECLEMIAQPAEGKWNKEDFEHD